MVGRGTGDAVPLRAAGALIGPGGLAVRWTRIERDHGLGSSMDQSAGPSAEDIGCGAGRTAMTLSEYSFEQSLEQL